jgi:hypothetical protein
MPFPVPDCRLGFTAAQTAAIMGDNLVAYRA